MRWTYDLDARALYVYLNDGRPERQVETRDGLILDLDRTEAVVGVEILSPAAACDLRALTDYGVPDDDVAGLHWLLTSTVALLFNAPSGNLVVEEPVTGSRPPAGLHMTAA